VCLSVYTEGERMPTNQNHRRGASEAQMLALPEAEYTAESSDEGERDGIEEFAGRIGMGVDELAFGEAARIRQPNALPHPASPDEAAPPVVYATAASYRKGVEIPLANGEWVRLRPRSLMTMVRTGKLPNSLIGAARRMLTNQGRATNPNAPQDPQVARESLELQDYLITQLVSSMKFVMSDPDDCDDDEVSVAEMFEGDKNLIVAFAMQGQKALADFRGERPVS